MGEWQSVIKYKGDHSVKPYVHLHKCRFNIAELIELQTGLLSDKWISSCACVIFDVSFALIHFIQVFDELLCQSACLHLKGLHDILCLVIIPGSLKRLPTVDMMCLGFF